MNCPFASPKTLLVALLLASSLPTTTSADHLPDSKLARGKDESTLAGVEVYTTPIETVVRTFGNPTQQREEFPATRDVVGERHYLWKKRNITIQVGTMFADKAMFKGDLRETPYFVIVDGTDGTVGRTGRGLKLGDPYTAIAAIYGSRYVKKGRHITIQWETTTMLEIGWNERGVINHIELLGAE